MDIATVRELERLVSDLHDDGPSASACRRLEELLIDDEQAQALYWRLVDMHIALGIVAENVDPATAPAKTPLIQVADKPQSPWVILSGMVTLTVVLGLSVWLGDRGNRQPIQQADAQPRRREPSRVPTIARVGWDGPTFAADPDQWRTLAAVGGGAVPLRHARGELSSGYLLELPPGYGLHLASTFDATGENCLSVEEIVGGPSPAARKVTFHNSGAGPKPLHANPSARRRRYGVIGRWTEVNNSLSPRYFLLTGVHKHATPEPGKQWRVSQLAVLIETESVIHIGWDDSGPAPQLQPDGDFDDLAADVVIYPLDDLAGSETPSRFDRLEVLGSHEQEGVPPAPSPSDAFEFELPPWSTVVIKGASNASDHNELYVEDAEGGRRLWGASNDCGRVCNIGAVAVRNPTPQPRTLRLWSRHARTAFGKIASPLSESPRRLLFEQAGYSIIGFEDSNVDHDFNDTRVGILQFEGL